MNKTISFALLLILIHLGSLAMALEEPKYSVIQKLEKIEIRNYDSFLVAETLVTGDRQNSGREGFKILAGYIFGQNKRGETISMTAPVIQEEKDLSWAIQFMMPTKYNKDTLPTPKSTKVQFKTVPSKKMAAITYSGRWTDSNYQEHLDILKQEIEKAKLKSRGEPLWARYNSPMTPWFLRKNEILIELE